MGAKVQRFFLRVGLRKTLPLVAQKKFKLICLIYVLRIARANRAVKFSSGCLQNCGLEKSRGDRKNPLSTVGNDARADGNAPPALEFKKMAVVEFRGGGVEDSPSWSSLRNRPQASKRFERLIKIAHAAPHAVFVYHFHP